MLARNANYDNYATRTQNGLQSLTPGKFLNQALWPAISDPRTPGKFLNQALSLFLKPSVLVFATYKVHPSKVAQNYLESQ